jgi:hypothetical protein
MSASPRLSLGALYREMRAGLGDAGRSRMTVTFRQQTRGGLASDPGGGGGATLTLHALIDHRDGELDGAEVNLVGSSSTRSISLRRHRDGFAYSIDGGQRWGRFADPPRIFSLAAFQSELDQVVVEDVTFEPALSPRIDTLDVSLGRAAFARLLRIFSADLEEDPEALALSAFSVSLEAAEEVALDYWWSLSALAGPSAAPSSGAPAGPVLRVACSVSIRVAPAEGSALAEVVPDQDLPELGHVDDVWGLLRREAPTT